jgi:outer membrane protein TolC
MRMKNILKTIVFLMLLVFSVNGQTQHNEDSLHLPDLNAYTDVFKIPELQSCIDSAYLNSPLLKASDQQVVQLLEEIKIKKKSWLDYIFIDANTRYGLFNQLSVSQQTGDGSIPDLAFYSNKEQFNYFAGLTIRLPLSFFTNNQNEVKILRHNIREAELKREELKNELTRLVITEYFKLKSLQELLAVHQNNIQSTRLDYLNSSKNLENNMIGLTEFATISNQNTKALEAYITVKNEFFAQFSLLKLLTGTNLQTDLP